MLSFICSVSGYLQWQSANGKFERGAGHLLCQCQHEFLYISRNSSFPIGLYVYLYTNAIFVIKITSYILMCIGGYIL
jgi:hypothetical protein